MKKLLSFQLETARRNIEDLSNMVDDPNRSKEELTTARKLLTYNLKVINN